MGESGRAIRLSNAMLKRLREGVVVGSAPLLARFGDLGFWCPQHNVILKTFPLRRTRRSLRQRLLSKDVDLRAR